MTEPSDNTLLDPDLLMTFCLVAETRNFSRAALRLGIAQPVVTRKVKRLEEMLGVQLFERTNRGCELTESGVFLASRASGILMQLEQLKQEVQHAGQVVSGSIALGVTHLAAIVLAPNLLRLMAERWPALRVSVLEGVSRALTERLRNRELSLSLMYDPPTDPDLICTPLLMDRLHLIGPPGAQWASLKDPSIQQIAALPLVLPSAGQVVRVLLEEACAEVGVALHAAYEANSIPLLKSMVMQGLGYTILSRGSVAMELSAGRLMAVPLPQRGMSLGLSLVTTREQSRLRTVQIVSDLIVSETRRLAREGAWPGNPKIMGE